MSKKDIEEYRQTLKRAFSSTDEKYHIVMDGYQSRNSYLRKSWNYYLDNKYIKVETVELSQETFMKGYITAKGREWIK
ncbi:hypothetical protein KAR91_68830 [Candidatus Pacearchaeota archaeon]|nr:hypothetical protein [Candidatus Pacearchaeota archaeon]